MTPETLAWIAEEVAPDVPWNEQRKQQAEMLTSGSLEGRSVLKC
jgi:hypothetical protein